jgi:hypothetical protein
MECSGQKPNSDRTFFWRLGGVVSETDPHSFQKRQRKSQFNPTPEDNIDNPELTLNFNTTDHNFIFRS